MKKIILVIMLLVSVTVFPSENISRLVNLNEDFSSYIEDKKMEKWGEIVLANGKFTKSTFDIQKEKLADGNLKVSYLSEDRDTVSILSKSLGIIKREITMKKRDAKSEYDKFTIEAKDKTLNSKKVLNDKVVENKDMGITPDTIDLNPIILQIFLQKNVKNFFADTVTQKGIYNMEYIIMNDKSIESVGGVYKFPEEFKENLDIKRDYKIVQAGLSGLVALFYSHKFYFIFDKNSCECIGYFGGDPKEAEFQYKINQVKNIGA